jgi:hypothetical protein
MESPDFTGLATEYHCAQHDDNNDNQLEQTWHTQQYNHNNAFTPLQRFYDRTFFLFFFSPESHNELMGTKWA